MVIETLIVEDNAVLRAALVTGLEETGEVRVVGRAGTGEEAVDLGVALTPAVVLMDVELRGGRLTGIEAAMALRRELPRLPVVFYSIQDDDEYFREFRESGILSHYAYVRKSNYLLPAMITPLLRRAVSGGSYIDPEIEARVAEVRLKDEESPLALLEPIERQVIALVARGLTNEQIAAALGLRDARAVSRANGQIYAAWRLNETPVDEKVARTRAALIFNSGRLILWDEHGDPQVRDERGLWTAFAPGGGRP
ncbi:MAG TPA: response regulator transcription factor [Anaerolineales bacterium]|nr:response regulator transcription factor [Anaerolineales bacterium]